MKFKAIINTHSGSVPDSAEDELRSVVEASGHTVEIHTVDGETLEDCCRNELASKCDGVIAWGGDGTLACVLNYCGKNDLPVLPLPGGTMNLLVKRIHGVFQSWKEVLERAIEAERQVVIPAIRCGDHQFYVGMLAGKLTQLTQTREHIRDGELTGAIKTLIENDTFNFETAMTLDHAGGSVSATAAGIFVPDAPERGMELITIDPESIADLLKIGLESLYADWDQVSGVQHALVNELHISMSGETSVPVTFDGELADATPPLTITLVREAVKVWVGKPE